MISCRIVIQDEVNVKVENLPVEYRRKIANKLKFQVPYARYLPQYKLGRWDGTISFFGIGGTGYVNHLDIIVNTLVDAGVEIADIVDKRQKHELTFDAIDENYWGDTTWPEGHQCAGQPIVLRDYQVEVVNNFIKSPQALQEVATGAGKTIITGEGGMITTNNKKIGKYCFEYIDHGHENNKKFSRGNDTCKNFGFNYRMTELQAAVGLAQLKKLDYIIKKQKKVYQAYEKIIMKYKGSVVRPIVKNTTPTYDTLIITFNKKLDAKKFTNYLYKNNIGTKILPDAIKWHFAKYWSQFENHLNLRKGSLKKKFSKTENFLSRSVGIPIMIKTPSSKINMNVKILSNFI